MLADDQWIHISGTTGEFTTPTSQERYDHAFMSSDLFTEEYVAGSWDVRREVCDVFPDQYLERISNHCPVAVRLRGSDDDTEGFGEWGQPLGEF